MGQKWAKYPHNDLWTEIRSDATSLTRPNASAINFQFSTNWKFPAIYQDQMLQNGVPHCQDNFRRHLEAENVTLESIFADTKSPQIHNLTRGYSWPCTAKVKSRSEVNKMSDGLGEGGELFRTEIQWNCALESTRKVLNTDTMPPLQPGRNQFPLQSSDRLTSDDQGQTRVQTAP